MSIDIAKDRQVDKEYSGLTLGYCIDKDRQTGRLTDRELDRPGLLYGQGQTDRETERHPD